MSTINPRTARVTIYQGDDLARLTELDEVVATAEIQLGKAEKRVREAATSGRPRLQHETPPGVEERDAAKEHLEHARAARDQFAAEAEDRGVTVALHAVPRKKWRELARQHPARPEIAEDSMGVNMDEFPDSLVPLSIDRDQSSIVGDLDEFLDSLSDQDYYDRLFLTAFALNRGAASADPTLRLGSVPSQTSSATSS